MHPDTIRNRLKERQIYARRPYKGPILTRRHRVQRLQWARRHLPWTRNQWANVLFSDESRFNVSMVDGRKRVWRRRGERYADACVLEHDRWGGGSVLVWAGISSNYRTRLVILRQAVNAQRYRDEVLGPVALPFMRRYIPNGIFQHDNARPHTARLTTNFLQANNVNVMDWPSLSPDLAPIEHLWDELGRRVYARDPQPANPQQLERALLQEWQRIPQNVIRRLVLSMRRRCNACIQSRGGHTRY
ncbi:MAG: transposase [Candidatus Thiodiazotropha sp.]